jgi:hypothetical protein
MLTAVRTAAPGMRWALIAAIAFVAKSGRCHLPGSIFQKPGCHGFCFPAFF